MQDTNPDNEVVQTMEEPDEIVQDPEPEPEPGIDVVVVVVVLSNGCNDCTMLEPSR